MITLHSNGTIDGLAAGVIPATSIEDAYASGGFNNWWNKNTDWSNYN